MQEARWFETGAATHVGKVRLQNEDSYLTRPEAGIWAVADGMGGHEAGGFASYTVIEALRSIRKQNSAVDLLTLCQENIFDANSRLLEFGRKRGGIVGTTVAVLLTFDEYFACLWSGDSRIYLVQQDRITQVSRDHTEVQDLLAAGAITSEEAMSWRGGNAITRAIGVFDPPELEMSSGSLGEGDTFVLCSDGLTQHVEDGEILRYVASESPHRAFDRLVELTLERGAVDNVTVVIAQYSRKPSPTSSADGDWPAAPGPLR